MKIVVIGATGLIGAKIVTALTALGHETVRASRNTGVNTVTGEGLAEALEGAAVVVDVANAPTFLDVDAAAFFRTSTTNLLAAAQAAGARHHVALSIVGADDLTDSGYFNAKVEQEALIAASELPYTIVHATPFFEFVETIADAATQDNVVRLASVLFQPMAAQDVAKALVDVVTGEPANGIVEIAGPEQYRLDELVRLRLGARRDARQVVADPRAEFFGAQLRERTLLPADRAILGETRFQDWLQAHTPAG